MKDKMYSLLGWGAILLLLLTFTDIVDVMENYSDINKMNVMTVEMLEEGRSIEEVRQAVKAEPFFGFIYIDGQEIDGPGPIVIADRGNLRVEVRKLYTWKPVWGRYESPELTMISKRAN